MTYTSDRPITVDGVRLDTLAYNITSINRSVAGRRAADQEVPGVDGNLPSLNDNLEPGNLGLEMFVRGTDEDGVKPGDSRTAFWNNLESLVHLFGKRHALLEIQEQPSPGVYRRAWAKVLDTIEPDMGASDDVAVFTVGMLLPYGVWEDLATADWTGTNYVTTPTQEVTTLQGSSERITDAILLVKGPATNPRVTDPNTGAYVQLNAALSAADYWRVNVATWSSRTGALGLGSSDATGTDRSAVTQFGGTRNQAAFLPMVPVRAGTLRKVSLTLTATATLTNAATLSVRARRKYAL